MFRIQALAVALLKSGVPWLDAKSGPRLGWARGSPGGSRPPGIDSPKARMAGNQRG